MARGRMGPMVGLSDIYNTKILELAANIPLSERLATPDASASAHSKLCGSTIELDVTMKDGKVAQFGQQVKACLLGQAAASVVGRNIIGTPPAELRAVAGVMRAMLKEGGPQPDGRWADLGLLQSVKDYPARHTSTMLVFNALEKAFTQIEGKVVAAPVGAGQDSKPAAEQDRAAAAGQEDHS